MLLVWRLQSVRSGVTENEILSGFGVPNDEWETEFEWPGFIIMRFFLPEPILPQKMRNNTLAIMYFEPLGSEGIPCLISLFRCYSIGGIEKLDHC